jgi:hypothetical protein
MKTQNSRNPIDRSPLRSGLPRKQQVPRTQAMGIIRGLLFIALALGYFALSPAPNAFGVVPAPDGCYPNFTTAEGCDTLNSLTTGAGNTGVGWRSLFLNSTASFNTALGTGALVLNNGDSNTATGTAALLLNTTGIQNTATGTGALVFNAGGQENTATGAFALYSNTEGDFNTANGEFALQFNTIGERNTAIGTSALYLNTEGSQNVALGNAAGGAVTTGSNIIAIGSFVSGVSTGLGEVDDSCYIGNIHAHPYDPAGSPVAVMIDLDGKLGTNSSSRRFKHDIKPMDKASEAILSLKPVTFHYKIDKKETPQFGLVAEEVAEVNPDLVARDKNGEIYTVRYEAVNAMLLNEFLKEHRKVEQQGRKMQEQEASISQLKSTVAQQQKESQSIAAKQQKEIKVLTATLEEQASEIQKVSAQVELQKAAPQTVLNNQ